MDILGGGLVGRPAQEIGKLFDVADILVVRLGAEPADRHVLGHWGLLSWVRFLAPQSQDRTPASATPRDPSLATNYRGSGLVLRRKRVIRHVVADHRRATPGREIRSPCRMQASGHPTTSSTAPPMCPSWPRFRISDRRPICVHELTLTHTYAGL